MLFYMVVEGGNATKPSRQLKIEESLMTKIGQEDKEALAALYQLTERAVYTYVLSIVKNPVDTQDIVQETYLKIRASAHLYVPLGKPLAWIFTIARNLSMNFFRERGKEEEIEQNWQENSLQYSYVSDVTDRMVLTAALNILSERDRQIVLLHVVSGLKHREIAKNLNLPISTVLSGYQRALQKLKKYLTEGGAQL